MLCSHPVIFQSLIIILLYAETINIAVAQVIDRIGIPEIRGALIVFDCFHGILFHTKTFRIQIADFFDCFRIPEVCS